LVRYVNKVFVCLIAIQQVILDPQYFTPASICCDIAADVFFLLTAQCGFPRLGITCGHMELAALEY
jgi:hypothetical protein